MTRPPELIPISDFGGDWVKYEKALYQMYLHSLVRANLTFLGHPVKTRSRPKTRGMEFGFRHLITKASRDKRRSEEEREPDFSRCERLPWVSWCIENAEQEGLSYWENRRGRETHVVVWAELYNFVVILDKRMPSGLLVYYLLTAYCPEEHIRRKLRKERAASFVAQNG